jgi:glycosyltransferase involved in cell wall biosynthesis
MESMALGVPVIGSDARGVRDLLEECGGFQVPVGDSAALGRAMFRLIREPDLAQCVGALARSKVERYGLPNLVHMHEQLYDELLAERRSGSSHRSGLPYTSELG